MWEILLHPNVRRFLDKLERTICERIENKLRELKEEPFRFLEHFEGEDHYDIDFRNKLLIVRALDHRKKIYKMAY